MEDIFGEDSALTPPPATLVDDVEITANNFKSNINVSFYCLNCGMTVRNFVQVNLPFHSIIKLKVLISNKKKSVRVLRM